MWCGAQWPAVSAPLSGTYRHALLHPCIHSPKPCNMLHNANNLHYIYHHHHSRWPYGFLSRTAINFISSLPLLLSTFFLFRSLALIAESSSLASGGSPALAAMAMSGLIAVTASSLPLFPMANSSLHLHQLTLLSQHLTPTLTSTHLPGQSGGEDHK